MRINSINCCNNYQPTFGINLQSKKLNFRNEDFFINIKGYEKDTNWAKKIIEIADDAVSFFRENFECETILRYITGKVRNANKTSLDTEKAEHSGILRTKRKYWQHGSSWKSGSIITRYDGENSKYKSYEERLDRIIDYPLRNPFHKFMLTRPESVESGQRLLSHCEPRYVNRGLDMVFDLYNDLHNKYKGKEISEPDMQDINEYIAEIRWILAHTTPWERGSDAISNTFIRSIYKSMGIKTSPLKDGVSLDLEAYCTNLNVYMKNFSSYFTHKPYIVE